MPKKQQSGAYFTDEELRVSRRTQSDAQRYPRAVSGQRYAPKNTASANTRRGAGQTAPRPVQRAAQTPAQRQPVQMQAAQRPAQQPSRPAGTNARPVLNDRQRAAYERAYYEKYGRLPYKNAPRNTRRDGAASSRGSSKNAAARRRI